MNKFKKNKSSIEYKSSKSETLSRDNLTRILRNNSIPDDQILGNLGLFLDSKNLSRILLMEHLFRETIGVHGDIMEFGCRWGQNAALFSALRGIFEPFK